MKSSQDSQEKKTLASTVYARHYHQAGRRLQAACVHNLKVPVIA